MTTLAIQWLEALLGDGPHHPALVHVPMALAVLMPVLAGLVALGARASWWSNRIWVLVVLFQAILAGSAWLAMQAGEEDAERVEKVVAEERVEEHEEAAEVLVPAAAAALGLAFLTLLLLPMVRAFRWGTFLTFLATLVVAGLAYRAGKLGGELVYRHGAAEAHRAAPR